MRANKEVKLFILGAELTVSDVLNITERKEKEIQWMQKEACQDGTKQGVVKAQRKMQRLCFVLEDLPELKLDYKPVREFVAAVHTLSVSTSQKQVQVKTGHNITLPCTYESSVNPGEEDFVAWMKMPDEVEIINRYLYDGGTWINDAYKGRVNFSGNTNNRDIGILLSQVTMNDNGTYECSVRIRNDLPSRHETLELLVREPPSKPDCKIIGTPEYGQNINLTCNSIKGSPKPEYSWQSYNPENKLRALGGTVMPGVLMLTNISTDTTGYYICLSKNSEGESFCNITVNVIPPSMNFALIGGVIGGLVAAIIIIAVVAYCCCCRNGEDKDYKMTETENGYQPPSIRIRGPAEEEVQDEDEDEEERHHPVQPPTSRLSPEV